MKRIRIETADKTYLAKPLTLGQLEENEDAINGIVKESEEVATRGGGRLPVKMLRSQARIVLLALQNHDKTVTADVTNDFSVPDIAMSFAAVISGSGLVEVSEGEAQAG